MHITSKGQVTIPKKFRDLCGLHPNTEAQFALVDGKLFLQPAEQSGNQGLSIVEHLRRYAKYRNGFTTDEIMAMTRGED